MPVAVPSSSESVLRRARVLSAALIGVMLAWSSPALAQAWTRDQGRGYLNVSLNHVASSEVYGASLEPQVLATTYRQVTLGVYGELGLVDRWLTLSVSAELLRHNSLAEQATALGLGDARVGLWTGLVTAPLRLTVGVLVGLPLGDSSPSASEGATLRERALTASLPLGDGELDVQPTVVAGYAFGGGGSAWPLRHYTSASVGYWIRTLGRADALAWQAELGTQIELPVLDRLWWIARARGVAGRSETYGVVSGEVSARIVGELGLALTVESAPRAQGIIASTPVKAALSIAW